MGLIILIEINRAFCVSFPGLSVDYFNHRLYWADPELSHIGSMRTDGSDPLVTISERHGKVKQKVHRRQHALLLPRPHFPNYLPFIFLSFDSFPFLGLLDFRNLPTV